MTEYFRSGGTVYAVASLDQITPRDLITFPRDAAEVLGRRITWHEVETAWAEIDGMTEKEADEHELADFLLAVSIWVSRRAAGDRVSFGQCLDDPFEWLPTPTDREPGKPKAQPGKKKKQKQKPSQQRGSGRPGGPATRAPESTTPATSLTGSTPESST